MKVQFLAIPVILVLVFGTFSMPFANAQFQQGGVDKEGSWYPGEGLKQGDFFSYRLCYVDYKECAPFEMDIWIEGDRQVGSEEKWVAQVIVYDGNKIVKGELELGKVAPEPTGGSTELGPYRSAFKSSIVWLSAFATAYGEAGGEGPKKFSSKSWGKIGNIGGEQVIPMAIEDITVPAGTFEETVLVAWKTGGATSKVWVLDEFPFPVKARTFTHVSEGIPPPEYQFDLLDYQENLPEAPFADVPSTAEKEAALGCPSTDTLTKSVKKPTSNFGYQIHAFYAPEEPVQGCPMTWLIKFISKFDDTEFLNEVQYDLMVVELDQNGNILFPATRTISSDEGKQFLFSPSGQTQIDMIVEENPGTAHYLIMVYGLAPMHVIPASAPEYVLLEIPIRGLEGETTPKPSQEIPSWIKNNAGWWADGQIDDNSFVQGIQWLIQEGIMVIPPTAQGEGGSNEIPSWIKNNAGWWADGQIDDNSFVQGIQWLIEEGIMSITS